MTTQSRNVVRVGVIGAGAMGTSHVRTLASWVPGCAVVSVYDADVALAKEVAVEVAAFSAEGADQLITSDEVDAVIIAAPDPLHEELVLACLAAGKPVLCEKPLATGAEGSQRIVDAEVSGGRRLIQVGFMRRFDPAFVELRSLLERGEIGSPRVVHCVHRNPKAHPTATSEGIVVNSMIHELDHLPWLLSDTLASISVTSPRSPAGELRDPQVAVIETAGGVLATVEVFVNARYGYDVQCEVVGDAGTARLTPPYGLSVRREGADGVRISHDFVRRFADAYRIELSAWVSGVQRGGGFGPSAWDGHRANLAAAAGVESLHSHARVKIPTAPTPPLYH